MCAQPSLTRPLSVDISDDDIFRGSDCARCCAISPELKLLRARRNAARVEIAKTEASHQPTLDVMAQITRSDSENVTVPSAAYANRAAMLQLTVPLYSGGLLGSYVRQSNAEWVRAEGLLEAARPDLGLQVHQEHRGLTQGVHRIRALEQAVRSVERLVQSSKRSFEAGVRTVLDVLNAEQKMHAALWELARARYLHLLSNIRMQALTGADARLAIEQVNRFLAPESVSIE